MTIGQRIKTIRKKKEVTQKRLAELSGIAEITIRQYEADKYQPKAEAVKKLAAALDVTPVDIMGYDYWDETIDVKQITKITSKLETFDSYLERLGYTVKRSQIAEDSYEVTVSGHGSTVILDDADYDNLIDSVDDLIVLLIRNLHKQQHK